MKRLHGISALLLLVAGPATAQYVVTEIAGTPNPSAIEVQFTDPSINNAGEVSFLLAATPAPPSPLRRTSTIIWHDGDLVTPVVQPMYISWGPGSTECTALGLTPAEEAIVCRGASMHQPILTNTGQMIFPHGYQVGPVLRGATEVVVADTSTLPGPVSPPEIIAQWADSDAVGSTFEFTEQPQIRFNGTETVLGYGGRCATGGRVGDRIAYLRTSGPIAGAAFGGPSAVTPPLPVIVDRCDAAIEDVVALAIQPGSTQFAAALSLDVGGGVIEQGIYVGNLNNPGALTRVLDAQLRYATGRITDLAFNAAGRLAVAGADCDANAGPDVCVIETNSGNSLVVLPGVPAERIAVNASGTVAFVTGPSSLSASLRVWDPSTGATNTVVQVGDIYTDALGNSYPLASLHWQKYGFNDNGEFVIRVYPDLGTGFDPYAARIAKVVPPAGAPAISVTDSAAPADDLNGTFGDVNLNTTSVITVTVTNTGSGGLTIGTIGGGSSLSPPFSRQADTCTGTTLAAGNACTFEIAFTPSAEQDYFDSTNIPSDDPALPDVMFSVSGTGVLAPQPRIIVTDSIAPDNEGILHFPPTDVGTTMTGTITVSNTGTGDLVIGNVNDDATLSLPFVIASDACSNSTVVPGAQCLFDVEFSTTATGRFTGRVNIPSNAPNGNPTGTPGVFNVYVDVIGDAVLSVAGEIAMEAATRNVIESDGDIRLNVVRQVGVVGQVSVDYMSVPVTANDTADYTAVSGTVIFADRENFAEIAVPILDDAETEGPETFRVELSNPTGGAVLVTPVSTEVTIIDNEAPVDLGVDIVAGTPYRMGSGQIGIDYTLTVTNFGGDYASGVTGFVAFDPGPHELAHWSDDGNGSYAAAQGVWTIGNLGPLESVVLNLRTEKVDSANGGPVTIEFRAQADQEELEFGRIHEKTLTIGAGGADLSATLTDEVDPVTHGGRTASTWVMVARLDYSTVNNQVARDVVLRLDTGNDDVGEITPAPTECTIIGAPSLDRGFECLFPEVRDPIELRVQMTPRTPGGQTVTSTLTVSSSTFDPDPENNSDAEETTLEKVNVSTATGGLPWCFIATAAYGSPWETNVEILRVFRDRFLLTNAPGRAFVNFYYTTSPPIANWIAEREWARVATRAILTPIVHAIKYPGGVFTFLAYLVLIVSLRRRRITCRTHNA